MQAVIIPARTVVNIDGIPMYLAVDTIMETAPENLPLLTGYSYATIPDTPPGDRPVVSTYQGA